MGALSYMQRRPSGIYEFRKRIPGALAGKPAPLHMREGFRELWNENTGRFKRELVRSLETNDLKEAKRRNHREAVRIGQLLDTALVMAVTVPQTAAPKPDTSTIEQEVLQELLATDAEERNSGDDRRRMQTVVDRGNWPALVPAVPLPEWSHQSSIAGFNPLAHGMTFDHFCVYGDLLKELDAEYREAWARSDPSIVRAETRQRFKRRGIPFDESNAEFREVGLAVLKAHVQAYALMLDRQNGKIVESPTIAKSDRGPKISEALASWKTGGRSGREKIPAPKTVVEAERAVRSFRELHGDMSLGEITKEHARTFRDALAKTPKAMPNALRNLPLPMLLERDLSCFQSKSATTVNKLLGLVGGIISQTERDGALDKLVPTFVNPFAKNMLLRSSEGDDSREPFDQADLKAIFMSPVYASHARPEAGGDEAAFWFPLVALLSGMRLDEIAQLRLCDLRQDEETSRWFFDIGRTGGRRTKTASSIRRVPVHQELVRIGLVLYRQRLLDREASPESLLWPGVSQSARWSKWFGRYLRRTVRIIERKKVFHSFRHTFKRMTRDAGLQEELHDTLTGHSGNGSVGRSYGSGFSLRTLIAAMDKITAPLDLTKIAHTNGPASSEEAI
jgi:integrase